MVSMLTGVNPMGRYSTNETCELLGIHRTTLERYVRLGKIKFKIRRATTRKFFPGTEIIRFWKAEV